MTPVQTPIAVLIGDVSAVPHARSHGHTRITAGRGGLVVQQVRSEMDAPLGWKLRQPINGDVAAH